ncbi:MAG: ATP-dependent helicase [Pseudomonadota bacterium]
MINLATELNAAQYEAATTLEGPVLVIAGAGSGKTRTVVYRLANLLEQGVPSTNILLLTFTRKAAAEMLHRAGSLLGYGVQGIAGGTFHAFAYSLLRQYGRKVDEETGRLRDMSIMDSSDSVSALHHCKDALGVGKGDRSFPKAQTVLGMLSKARNKEMELDDVVRREAFHLLVHADAIAQLGEAYTEFKEQHGLLDYDDLLFELENMLKDNHELREMLRERYRYIMVDEFQDTNLVQARIVQLLAGERGNIMAVGDDAQSIYAFRGANVQNILSFPKMFEGTKIIKLEENYRSTQPILDLTNAILAEAPEAYQKRLYTSREDGDKPQVIRPLSDLTQANIVVSQISKLLKKYPPHEIAVLFRAGFHSYHVEVQLTKLGVKFQKFGGLRYSDAAHVKDIISFAKLVINPMDLPAFQRVASLTKGVGPKTCLKLYDMAQQDDTASLSKACGRYPQLRGDLELLDRLRQRTPSPVTLLEELIEHYQPRLEVNHPDDWPRRLQGLEQMVQIAAGYQDLDLFVSDIALEDPSSKEEARDCVVLSTIHSSKGLEWDAVILLDLVEERFPSRHALHRADDFEEERRLMYVACTRAREQLILSTPASLYQRGGGGNEPAIPSPFVRELSYTLYDEWKESYAGGLQPSAQRSPSPQYSPHTMRSAAFGQNNQDKSQSFGCQLRPEEAQQGSPMVGGGMGGGKLGRCRHKIFGQGKIIQHLPPDKYRVNFPGIGLKVILGDYLVMEDD